MSSKNDSEVGVIVLKIILTLIIVAIACAIGFIGAGSYRMIFIVIGAASLKWVWSDWK